MVLMPGFLNLFKELAEFGQKNRDRDVQLQQIKMQRVGEVFMGQTMT